MGSMQGTKSTKTLLLHGAKDLRVETRPICPPIHDEIQVHVKSTSLCGSDLHYYTHGRNGDFVVRAPFVLGHESSGIVTAVGPSVTNLSVNDRVVLEMGLPCNNCSLCKSGRYNICPTLKFGSSAKAFPHVDGTLTELVNHPAASCHKLPPNVSFEAGALIEPLSVCLQAMRRSNPPLGSSALVMGAGAIGLLLAALLSVHGVTTITIADIDAARLEIAASLPYHLHTVRLPKTGPAPTAPIEERLATAQALASTLRSSTPSLPADSFGFDLAYDCTGIESCVQISIYALAPGSKLVIVGMGRPVQTLPIGAAALREVDIIGVFRYANCYPAAIRLAASGKLDGVFAKLVTHRRDLGKGEEAFELAAKGVDGEGRPVVKVVVES